MGELRAVRFLHTADLQLGMTRHFLAGEAQARFAQARIDVIGRIGSVARERDCSFVVVAGDVFDSNFVDRRVILRSLGAMGATGIPFLLLPGNHDTLGAGSIYLDPQFVEELPELVHVLVDERPVDVLDGVQVVGAPWTSKHPTGDPLCGAAADLLADGAIRILVGHGAVRGVAYDGDSPSLIEGSELRHHLDRGAVHYVALGDRHSTTCVDGLDGRVWYSGAPEPTAHDEVDAGNVLVVEVDGETCGVEPVRVGTWTFHSVDPLLLDGPDDVAAFEELLAGFDEPACTVLRLAPVGSLNLRDHGRFTQALERAGEMFAAVQLWGRHTDLVVVPDPDEAVDLGLSGPAAAAFEELRARVTGGEGDARVAMDALALLHRLASGGGR